MMKSLTKAFAFFVKEFHDVRRQPRLLISLVGGPLLVLAAFGATFRSANPYVTSVLVWPKDGVPGISQEEAVKFIGSNFPLVKVTTDEAEAMQMLESGEVDVVQIVPELPRPSRPVSRAPRSRSSPRRSIPTRRPGFARWRMPKRITSTSAS